MGWFFLEEGKAYLSHSVYKCVSAEKDPHKVYGGELWRLYPLTFRPKSSAVPGVKRGVYTIGEVDLSKRRRCCRTRISQCYVVMC